MKKFYLLMVSLIVAMTAGAATYPDLYIRGAKFGWNAADCKEANKLSVDENGIYSIELENFSGGFKIADNAWGEHNYGGQGATTVELDKEYTLTNSSSSSDLTPGAAWSKVTLTFDINTLTLKVTGTGTEQKITWALCGDFKSNDWPDITFKGEGSELTCTLTPVKANGGFGVKKLADGLKSAWYTNNGATISETAPEATLAAGGGNTNWALTVGREYTVTFNPESGAIKFAWDGGDEPDPQPTSPDALYIVGNICDWTPENAVALTKEGDTFKATGLNLPDNDGYSWFSFTTAANAGWVDMTRFGATEDGYVVEAGTAAPFTYSTHAFKVLPGKYDIVVDFTSMTLTFTKVGGGDEPDPQPTTPEAFYIVGNLCNWAPENAVALTKEGTTFTGTGLVLPEAAEGYSYFSFTTAANAGWDDMTRYGAPEDGYTVENETPATFLAGIYAFKALAGTYDIVVDFAEMTITLTKVGGDTPEIYVPTSLYMMGDVNGTAWSTSAAPELTKEGKIFTLKSVTIDTAFDNDYGYFHFNELAGEDWPAVEAGHRFGATTADEELAITTGSSKTADLVMKAAPYSFKALPGIYKVAVSFEGDKPQVELSKLSDGVENVEISNDGAAEYFNLQGIRVAEPAPGIYIKRQGSKVTKVIVK